jgi:hypothetical protein
LIFALVGRLTVPGSRKMRSMFCVPATLPSLSIAALARPSASSTVARAFGDRAGLVLPSASVTMTGSGRGIGWSRRHSTCTPLPLSTTNMGAGSNDFSAAIKRAFASSGDSPSFGSRSPGRNSIALTSVFDAFLSLTRTGLGA